ILDEIVRRIREAVDPDKIILFGSRARGDAGPDSDYDILIIAPSDRPRSRRTGPLYSALAGIGKPKGVVWWTQSEADDWRNEGRPGPRRRCLPLDP
ncbi:MAG: nucleotidyltransferase domain-containing protein, partial [Armatimonadetes bacterium]|nr:nucleotidyltransferase domain-containing protein [Armatimonadota bacterium]